MTWKVAAVALVALVVLAYAVLTAVFVGSGSGVVLSNVGSQPTLRP